MTGGFPRSVTVYGTGLMGSSLALALRRHLPGVRIFGVDDPEILKRTEQLGIIDAASPEETDASDFAILAAPVGVILRLLDELPARHRLILDVGSTKVEICRKAALRGLPFIGGHPMTGLERSGPDAASATLFEKAPFFLCPIATTPPDALALLESLVTKIGSVPHIVTPEDHDRLVARLSHLPQILSTLLADQTAAARALAGPGWKSMTRLAASPFHVWHDILVTSNSLKQELRTFAGRVEATIVALESNDMDSLKELFERANAAVESSESEK